MRLLTLIVAIRVSSAIFGVPSASRSSSSWRRRILPFRGGDSGYDFTYEEEATNGNAPPELPPYGSQSPYLQQRHQREPPLLGDPRAYGGTGGGDAAGGPDALIPPPPPPLPDQFDNEPLPPMEDILEMPADTAEEEVIAPWDTTGQQKSIVDDLSAFDKDYILKGLARLYRKKILPLELASRYGHFHSPPLSPSDFDAPPLVLLLGQYSVGKTSFIKYLMGRDFPGIRVGPEPTTDRFTAILWGSQDRIIPGAALCSQMDRPFTGLNPFGNNFLSRMEAAELSAPILKNITLIDTPGILSGQKQRTRNYDYEGVMKWFAERADLIIVMFDAHKLDISDELKAVMELMIPHLDKIRIVLSKWVVSCVDPW